MFNYNDYVDVKIIKVKDEFGTFSHWEYEVRFDDKESFAGGGTAPTFYGAYDSSFEAIRNVAGLWMSNDANAREDD